MAHQNRTEQTEHIRTPSQNSHSKQDSRVAASPFCCLLVALWMFFVRENRLCSTFLVPQAIAYLRMRPSCIMHVMSEAHQKKKKKNKKKKTKRNQEEKIQDFVLKFKGHLGILILLMVTKQSLTLRTEWHTWYIRRKKTVPFRVVPKNTGCAAYL